MSCVAKPVVHSWTNSTLISQSISRKAIISFFARKYTGDYCEEDDDCDGDRECINGIDELKCSGGEDGPCVCYPQDGGNECSTSADCLENDICLKSQYARNKRFCFSCDLRAHPGFGDAIDDGNCDSSMGSSVCIAVDSLSSFAETSLVFPAHRRASVLCDGHGNCATPGHMVVYRSTAMSMASYCGQKDVFCTRRVKLVNSPKMRIGLRVLSFSNDLEFTAFAAARETKLEETVLKMLVFMGA